MRLFSSIFISVLASIGLLWGWINYPEVRTWALNIFHTGKFQTLEIRHTAESIMENNKRDLLTDNEHIFLEPDLKFHPYLLMEVKYTKQGDKTHEGVILWSLVEGEMVISTSNWDKTHGFMDCITASADRDDFKIINSLAQHGGSLDRDSLSKLLNVENDILDTWIDKCRIKSLIVQTGNHYRLHIQEPKLYVSPETKLDQWLVTKSYKNTSHMQKKFSASQIGKIAKAAFSNNFTIRKSTEIFLPIYTLTVQNPDGSQMTTYWNALNGKKFSQSYFIE